MLIFRRLGMTLDMIQRRRNLVPPAPSSCSPFLAPIGRGSASMWPLQELADVQNCPFHPVDQLPGRPRPLYQVNNRGFSPVSFRIQSRKTHGTKETSSKVRMQDLAFSFPRAPDPYGASKRGCARLQKPLPGPAPLVEAGHRTGAYVLPLAIPREANTGALRTSFFSGSDREEGIGPKPGAEEPGSKAPRGQQRPGNQRLRRTAPLRRHCGG